MENIEILNDSSFIDLLERTITRVRQHQNNEDFQQAKEAAYKVLEAYEGINQRMVQDLQNYFNDTLKTRKEYEDIINSLQAGSVLIYFKPAQRIKIYKKEELNTLLGGELRTVYKQFPGAYEIVPNNFKQKIIIIGDITLWDKIPNIKNHILKFMNSKGLKEFKLSDIVAYKNETNVDIIINNYYVENSSERDVIVNELVEYIYTADRNDLVASKLGKKNFSDFKDAGMYSVGTNKQQWMTDPSEFIEFSDILVSNINNCAKINKNGNTYVTFNVNIQNTNLIQSGNNNVSIIEQNSINLDDITDQDMSGEFITYLLINRPDWYKEGTLMDKNILISNYTELYGSITKNTFTKIFKGKLFNGELRGAYRKGKERATLVKVFTYNMLTMSDDESE
jgi:hypothetical protein